MTDTVGTSVTPTDAQSVRPLFVSCPQTKPLRLFRNYLTKILPHIPFSAEHPYLRSSSQPSRNQTVTNCTEEDAY